MHKNRWWAAICVAVLVAVSGCGGGGGGSNGGGDPPPDNGGGNNPPPPAETPGKVGGRLWHTNYALDYYDGMQIASLSGELPVRVTTDDDLTVNPWPDGSQYTTRDYDTSANSTDISVYTLADRTQRYHLVADGYVRNVRPSPVSKSVVIVTWSDDYLTDTYTIFYDFATNQELDRFESSGAVSWLPDGRYLQVKSDGAIYTGEVGGASTKTGALALPADAWVGGAEASPDGKKFWLEMINKDNTDSTDSDLWVANIDGSGLRRYTKTTMTYYGTWSPDSKFIAYSPDAGYWCTGVGCTGSCSLWYASADASEVQGLVESDIERKFRVKDHYGGEADNILGCELGAWTP